MSRDIIANSGAPSPEDNSANLSDKIERYIQHVDDLRADLHEQCENSTQQKHRDTLPVQQWELMLEDMRHRMRLQWAVLIGLLVLVAVSILTKDWYLVTGAVVFSPIIKYLFPMDRRRYKLKKMLITQLAKMNPKWLKKLGKEIEDV